LSSFWLTLKQQWTIKISSPLFSIFSLVAILVGSRDHRTQFWKGAIQGPFHQSLVAIGPVVSEEKIKMWNVDGRTKSDDNSSPGLKARWAKNVLSVSNPCLIKNEINCIYRQDNIMYYFHNCTTVTSIYFCNKIERMSHWWIKIDIQDWI
jgi:hypothetical protein